jgi:hypothetical protein
LDPDLRADLQAIADKHGLDTIPHRELVATCIGYRHPKTNVYAPGRSNAHTPGRRKAA